MMRPRMAPFNGSGRRRIRTVRTGSENGRRGARFVARSEARYTRRRYSPVRVSISMRSPVVTNSGT